mgnify:CR=1 FL=1
MDADDTDSHARETRALDRLGILLGARVQRDVKLAAYTTYKVGGPASLLVKARSIDDLHAVSNALREKRVPLLVIGRGSNLLVADEGFAGLVVVLGVVFCLCSCYGGGGGGGAVWEAVQGEACSM